MGLSAHGSGSGGERGHRDPRQVIIVPDSPSAVRAAPDYWLDNSETYAVRLRTFEG